MNIRMPTQEEIHTAFEQGEEAVVKLFAVVGEQVEALAGQLAQQGAALKELQARLGKNSRNTSTSSVHRSGKPPSSDGYGKPPVRRTESLRKKGDKPNGGQPGHEGDTLKQSETPDVTKTHEAENCGECGASLKEVEAAGHEERQVFDTCAELVEASRRYASK